MLTTIIYAQQAVTTDPDSGIPTLQGLEAVFANLVSLIIPAAGIVLFIYLMLGGFRYITAGSDPGKAEGAKNTITYAILGMILLAMAYLIINFIASFTGASYLRYFKIRVG
jgi:RsiW-degrading membrane proteinase PrsW (M82 family)